MTNRITLPPLQLSERARKRENLTEEELRALQNFDLQALAKLGLAVPREQPRPQPQQRQQPEQEPEPSGPGLLDRIRNFPTPVGGTFGGFEDFLRGADDAPVGRQVVDVGSKLGGAAINTLDFIPAQFTPTDPLTIAGTTDYDSQTEAMLREMGILPEQAGTVFASIENQQGANPVQRVRNFQQQPLGRQIGGGVAFDPLAAAGAVGNIGRIGAAGRFIGRAQDVAEIPSDVRQAAQLLGSNRTTNILETTSRMRSRLSEITDQLDDIYKQAERTGRDDVFETQSFEDLANQGDALADNLGILEEGILRDIARARTKIDEFGSGLIPETQRRGAQIGSRRGEPFIRFHSGGAGGQGASAVDFTPREGLHVGTLRAATDRTRAFGATNFDKLVGHFGDRAWKFTSRAFNELAIQMDNPYLPNGRVLDERIGRDNTLLRSLEAGFGIKDEARRGGLSAARKYATELLGGEFDVVPYINAVENPGSISYMILDPEVILFSGNLTRSQLQRIPRGGRGAADVIPPFGHPSSTPPSGAAGASESASFIQKFTENFYRNPLNEREAIVTFQTGRAEGAEGQISIGLELVPSSDSVHISHIRTLESGVGREAGGATAALRLLTKAADEADMPLTLSAVPTEPGIDAERLKGLYKRFDFVFDPGSDYGERLPGKMAGESRQLPPPPSGASGSRPSKRNPINPDNIFRMTNMQAQGQLNQYERLQNKVRRFFRMSELNPHVQLAMRERAIIHDTVTSVATVLSQNVGRIARNAFEMDDQGVIASLQGVDPFMQGHAPTISDVAARLPKYRKALTQEQLAALEEIRLELKPIQDVYRSVFNRGVKTKREDIIRGGFYITRGSLDPAKTDLPKRAPRRGPQVGPAGVEKQAMERPMGHSIGLGGEWLSFEDAISSYVHGLGRRVNDQHTANYFQYRALDENLTALYGAGESMMPFPGLEGSRKFSAELADAMARATRGEGPHAGSFWQSLAGISALNAAYRGLKATADLSFFGVQATLTTYESPSSVLQAAKGTGRALWKDGDRALQPYLEAFDARSPVKSLEWAQEGLRVGGSGTEFRIGGPFSRWVGIRHVNRAFGQAGDVLRLELAETELMNALRTKSLDELRASGDLKRIANAANVMTGWSRGRFAGDAGEFGQFAPRFFQSRLDTIALAVKGTANAARPGVATPRDQVLARRAFLKMIGLATMMTIVINEARGYDTELFPIKDGKPNPDFLRVKNFFGRDISLLGPWDSFQRLNLGLGLGVMTGDLDAVMQSIRGQASGVVSNTWDTIAGTDFYGRPTGALAQKPLIAEDGSIQRGRQILDPKLTLQQIGSNFVAFSGEEYVTGLNQIRQGEIAEGVTTFTSGLIGLRSSPLGFRDHGDNVARETGLGSEWNDLETYQQNFLGTAHPELAQYDDEREAFGKALSVERLDAWRERRIAEILNARGRRSIKRAAISRMNTQYDERRDAIFGSEGEIKFGDSPGEMAMKERSQLIEDHRSPETKEIDWDSLDRHMRQFESRLTAEQLAFVRRNTNRLPMPRELLRVLHASHRRDIEESQRARQQHLRSIGQEDLISMLDEWFYPALFVFEEAA